MMFDQIITNGDWWKSEDQLESVLKRIYDAGFDGKIGLSYDSFHGQELNRIITFIKTVHRIWNQGDILNIQSVISENPEKIIEDLENFDKLALALNCNVELELNKKTGKAAVKCSRFSAGYQKEIRPSPEPEYGWSDRRPLRGRSTGWRRGR